MFIFLRRAAVIKTMLYICPLWVDDFFKRFPLNKYGNTSCTKIKSCTIFVAHVAQVPDMKIKVFDHKKTTVKLQCGYVEI